MAVDIGMVKFKSMTLPALSKVVILWIDSIDRALFVLIALGNKTAQGSSSDLPAQSIGPWGEDIEWNHSPC